MGGLILRTLTWHWIFFVNLPVGILGLIMVLRYIPARKPAGGERFDLQGAALLFITLISFLISLTAAQEIGFGTPLVLGLMAAAAIGLALFLRLESRLQHPMVDLSLFRRPLFSINLLTAMLAYISSAGTAFLMPFYLQNILGYNPSQAGLLLAIVPLSMGITAPISGSASDRIGTRRMAVIGLGILLLGFMLISTLSVNTSPLGYILRFLPIGIGMGLFQTPNNSAVMGSRPPNRLGISSGLLSLTRTLGQITGIAVLGAIWAGFTVRAGGFPPGSDVTGAPAAIQVAALNITSRIIVGIIAAALGLSIWAVVLNKLHPERVETFPVRIPPKSQY
jgi:MFS family permease